MSETTDLYRAWSRFLPPDGNFKIVVVSAPLELANQLHYERKLDTIRPARFATLRQLEGLEMRAGCLKHPACH